MPSTMPVPVKPRPYRRFANSILHTRFVRCAGLALLWHFCLQALANDWYSSVNACFWSFFPLGFASLRAILFSITSLILFLFQIGSLGVGQRSTPANWVSIKNAATSLQTYLAFAWYLLSAILFSEVFAFTSPASRELNWITNGGYGAPDKINERPIYLRTCLLLLALLHAGLHVYHDYSALPLDVEQEAGSARSASTMTRFGEEAPRIFTTAAINSAAVSVLAPFCYNGFFRSTLWSWHIWWGKLVANIPRSEANPPNAFYVGEIYLYAWLYGLALSATWQFNIFLFRTYMLREPTKNTFPLSASSRDPNGTLLNGLSAKSPLTRTLALWELDMIAQRYPERRVSIFGDFERPMQGPIFTSMINASLSVINMIQTRMRNSAAASSPAAAEQSNEQPIAHLPRLLPNSIPAKSNIYQQQGTPGNTLTARASSFVSREAKTLGSSPNPWSPPVDRAKQLAIEYSSASTEKIQAYAEASQQSILGRYLLASSTRLIKSTILGSPYANPAQIIHAIRAPTYFLIASLQEDAFGKAVQCVPTTVKTFSNSIFAIEGFVVQHTNGGLVSAKDARELKDVVLVHQELKTALKSLLDKFQMFLSDVGLSIHDLNDARKASEDRELFKVVKPRPREEQHSSVNEQRHSTKTEMEEVSGKRPQAQARRSGQALNQTQAQIQTQQQTRRRQSQKESEESSADKQRPGRLFSQLDRDSAYQASLGKQQSSTIKGTSSSNPLLNVNKQSGEKSGNVLGARDFNSLPTGGLQRIGIKGRS